MARNNRQQQEEEQEERSSSRATAIRQGGAEAARSLTGFKPQLSGRLLQFGTTIGFENYADFVGPPGIRLVIIMTAAAGVTKSVSQGDTDICTLVSTGNQF